MKDLLKVSDDLTIVGLHDRVFGGSLREESADKEQQWLVELVPTPFQPNNKNNKNKSASARRRPPQQPADAPSQQAAVGDAPADCNPVQAVALYQQPSSSRNQEEEDVVVWCAVARDDKTLAVYRMDRSVFFVASSTAIRQIPVAVTHRTSKRASALCFATVPAAAPAAESEPLLVLIAADVAGDAVAFSTLHSSSSQHDDDHNNSNGDPDPLLLGGTTIPHRRLLLGHTASMLTSVALIQSLLLTADRDEKIRVSSFPNTHTIQGYLLGHTAFVSCIDTTMVVDQQHGDARCWCVSWGGDHTLRLWDCRTCQQLAMISTDDNNNHNNNNNNESKKDESDQPCPKRKPVPSKVTINARGDRIATICDESQKIYVWQVVLATEAGQVDILPCHHILCPNQPLAVSFYDNDHLLVLLRDPEYLQVYHIASTAAQGVVVSPDPTTTTTTLQTRCAQLGQVAASIRLPMPTSILERDAAGNLILAKVNEPRGSGAPHRQPWNNAQRIETAKGRQKRWRKRKAAEEEGSGEEEENDNGTTS